MQRSRHQIRAALGHLQAVLADAGIQSCDYRVDPVEDKLSRFDEHMQQAKGLAESSRLGQLTIVRSLLRQAASVTPTADELRHFIAQKLSRVKPGERRLADHCAAWLPALPSVRR